MRGSDVMRGSYVMRVSDVMRGSDVPALAILYCCHYLFYFGVTSLVLVVIAPSVFRALQVYLERSKCI